MKNLRKYAITLAIVSLVGASISGAAFAHGKQGIKQNGIQGFGQTGHRQKGLGQKGHGMHGLGQKGHGMHGLGQKGHGMHGLGGSTHSQKYLQLLVNSYAPDLKPTLEALVKAEKELQTQHDALRTSGAKIDRNKLPLPDQATIDANQKAHEAIRTANDQLATAIEADKAVDIATALKALVTAKQTELKMEQARFDAMKKAIVLPSTTPSSTPNTAPSTSPAPANLPTSTTTPVTLL